MSPFPFSGHPYEQKKKRRSSELPLFITTAHLGAFILPRALSFMRLFDSAGLLLALHRSPAHVRTLRPNDKTTISIARACRAASNTILLAYTSCGRREGESPRSGSHVHNQTSVKHEEQPPPTDLHKYGGIRKTE